MNEELFRRGLALFEEGQPFEAHEEWELCWRAAKERHDEIDERFLRALIHLCAARVKVRQKNAVGVQSHLESAVRLLEETTVASHRSIDVAALLEAAAALLAGDILQVEQLQIPQIH